MDQKKRAILAVAIAVTIIAGVLSGFGLPLFFHNAEIILPHPDETGNASLGEDIVNPGENADYTLLHVTKDTVQTVVATLRRKEQYYRELKVETYWGSAEQRSSTVYTPLIWNDGAYSKTAIMSPDGSLQNCLMADGKTYIWYSGDQNYFASSAAPKDIDWMQKIPSYEDVLALDKAQILRAGYDVKSNSIFLESRVEALGYLERFWISVETGLLTAAETVKEDSGILVYSMTEKLITALKSNEGTFALPNGTVLHRVILPQTEE